MNRCKVSTEELLRLTPPLDEYSLIRLCKEKGMPTKGTIAPRLDPDYRYTCRHDAKDLSRLIEWKRRGD